MLNVSLEQGSGITTMAAVAAAAILLAGVFYYRTFGQLGAARWLALFSLRIAAIVLIVLLLFRPVLSYYKQLQRRPALIFLLDRSASMGISDDATGVTRFNQARPLIERWWQKLHGDFDLHLIGFAERAETLSGVAGLAALTPDGKATSLSHALRFAADFAGENLRAEDVEAVVIFSDGIHNAAGDPLQIHPGGMVVHTVGVGASLRSDASYRDVQLAGIDCPDRLMLDNLAAVTASVDATGLAGRVVKVVLEEDGNPIADTALVLDEIEGPQEVTFDFRPTTAGRHNYTARVAPTGGERIEENNHRSAVATVVEPGIRVLYVEGTLRDEYGALVDRFLARDPDLEFCALVQTRPNKFLRRTNIPGPAPEAIPATAEEINRFDVFIIGDLDASFLREEQQELLVQRIREGAGLVMLGGYHSLGPGGYAQTPLGEILPVQLGARDVGQITESFLPRLSPDGTHHAIFANISDFFPTTQGPAKTAGLPLLEGCTRVEAARPAATVLATVETASGVMPVLAVQPLGQGRTAVFCGDTTRRWQQGPRVFDRESPFLRFWGQMVRWLAGRPVEVEVKAGIVAEVDKAYYEPGEEIHISAVVRDRRGEGAADATVVARFRDPSGNTARATLAAAPGPAGRYRASFEPDATGTWEIIVEARLGELTLTSQAKTVEVGRPNMEFDRLDLDQRTLAQIAAGNRGRYVHLTTADYLLERFDRSQRQRRQYVERKLYWPPLCWALFVSLLTAEWILRRRFQLR